jgi:thymidine phosphorylase
VTEVDSPEAGWLVTVDAEALGRAASALGAGRATKGDPIDPAVGIVFGPKIGDRIERGTPVAVVHARTEDDATAASARVLAAFSLGEEPLPPPPLVHGWHGARVDA